MSRASAITGQPYADAIHARCGMSRDARKSEGTIPAGTDPGVVPSESNAGFIEFASAVIWVVNAVIWIMPGMSSPGWLLSMAALAAATYSFRLANFEMSERGDR